MYGSEGLGTQRNIETPIQELANLVSLKSGETNPVPSSGYYSDDVSNRGLKITLRLAVSGEHKHSKVIKLTCKKLEQQQRGAVRLM